MAKCANLDKKLFENVEIAYVNPDNQTNKKPMLYDITSVNDTDIYTLFMTPNKHAAFKNIQKTIGDIRFYEKFYRNMNSSVKNSLLTKGLEPSDDPQVQKEIGNKIKARAVVLSEIFGTMQSEKDVQNNIGIDDEVLISSLYEGDARTINAIGAEEQIGRILLNQQGYRLVGDPDEVNKVHRELGKTAVDQAVEDGLVKRKKGNILNPGYFTKNKEFRRVKGEMMIIPDKDVLYFNFENLGDDVNVHEMNRYIEEGVTGEITDESLQNTIQSSDGIKRLITPSNMKPVSLDKNVAEEEKPYIRDLGDGTPDSPGVTPRHQKIMEELQSKRTRMNPRINKFFMALAEELQRMQDFDISDPENTLKKLYRNLGITSPATQNILFGKFTGSTVDDFKSKIGQSISKENPFIQMLAFYPELVDENGGSRDFYHQLGVYRTTRMDYLATFLNEQSQKGIRPLTGGAPVKFNINNEFGKQILADMVNSINDESKFDTAQILEEGVDPAFDELLQKFEDAFINPDATAKQQIMFMKNLANRSLLNGLKNAEKISGDPYVVWGALSGIYDIRQAQKNNGIMETVNRTKFDATTSGILLNFMQTADKGSSLNYDPSKDKRKTARYFLTALGYIGEETTIKDAYHILLNAMEDAKKHGGASDLETYQLITDFAKFGIFKSARDLVKPMVMVTNYQAGDTTAIASTSDELRDHIIQYLINNPSKEGYKYIQELVKNSPEGIEFYENNNLGKKTPYQFANTEGINIILSNVIAESISTNLREYISTELGQSSTEYKDRLSSMYKHMEELYLNAYKDDNIDGEEMPILGALPAIAWETMPANERATYDEFFSKPIEEHTDKEIKNFGKFHKDMLKKYMMPLTSKRQVLDESKDQDVIYLGEMPNALTPAVSMIHSIDSAIFFKSHEDTLKELQKIIDDRQYNGVDLTSEEVSAFKTSYYNASGMIHDANNADPIYNHIYKKYYRNNSVEISKTYDVEKQLMMTLASMANMPDFDMSYFKDMMALTQKNEENKIKALNEIDPTNPKFFGPPNEIEPSEITKETTQSSAAERSGGSRTKQKTTTKRTEHYDPFLNSVEGQADVALSEKKGGNVYDPAAEAEKMDNTDELQNYDIEVGNDGNLPRNVNDTRYSEEKHSIAKSIYSKAYKAFNKLTDPKSKKKYWMMDIESSFGTDQNPLGQSRVLEFYAEEYQGGKPTGKKIHHTFVPEFPEQYDAVVQEMKDKNGVEYMPYSYFRNNENLSEHVAEETIGRRKIKGKYFTEEGYAKFIEQIANELFKDGNTNLVAFNGNGFDFPMLQREINKYAPNHSQNMDYSTTYDSQDLTRAAHYYNENIPASRKLSDMFNLRATQEEKELVQGAHQAGTDVKMMDTLINDSLDVIEMNYADKLNEEGDLLLYGKTSENAGTEQLSNREVNKRMKEMLADPKNKDIKEYLDKYGSYLIGEKSAYNMIADLVQISNDANLSLDQLAEQIRHEISHQKSTAFISEFSEDEDVKQLKKYMEYIKNPGIGRRIAKNIKDPQLKNRFINKVVAQNSDHEAMLELVAIMHAEPDMRKAIMKAIGKTRLGSNIMDTIRKVMRKLMDFIVNGVESSNANSDLVNNIDPQQLYQNIVNIIEKGTEYNKGNSEARAAALRHMKEVIKKERGSTNEELSYDARQEMFKNNEYKKRKNESAQHDTELEKKWRNLNTDLGLGLNILLYNSVYPLTFTMGSTIHEQLKRNSYVYNKVSGQIANIWNTFEPGEKVKTYLDRTRIGDLAAFSMMESIQMNAEQDANKFRDDMIHHLKTMVNDARVEETVNGKTKRRKLTNQERADMTYTYAYSPIFHLMTTDDINMKRIVESSDPFVEIDTMINEVINDSSNNTKVTEKQRQYAENIALISVHAKNPDTYTPYNLRQTGITKEGNPDLYGRMEKLVALYSLKNANNVEQTMNIAKQNPKMHDELTRMSLALKRMFDDIIRNNPKEDGYRESLISDMFKNQKQFKVIRKGDEYSTDFTAGGWKVLREPKGNEYGIAYRDISRITKQTGAGITNNIHQYDISVPYDMYNPNAKNVQKVYNGTNKPYHKLALTKDEIDKIGDMVEDPVDLLVRTYTNFMLVHQTQAVRNYVVYGDKIMTKKSPNEWKRFDKKLKKMDKAEMPWFLSTPKTEPLTDWLDKHPEIKKNYKVPEHLTRLAGFNEKIDLVRRDIHDMAVGYNDIEIFHNDTFAQKAAYIVRQMVVRIKQTWVVLTPSKIKRDIISNQMVLGGYNVPVRSIIKYQAEAIPLLNEYTKMRGDYSQLLFQINAEPDEQKRAILEGKAKKLEKKLRKHKMAPLYQNGMIQSISSDIVLKDNDVVTGLQHDIDSIINSVAKDDNGDLTGLGEAVMWFAHFGFEVDNLLKWLSKNLKAVEEMNLLGKGIAKYFGETGRYFEGAAKRIKMKKKEKNVARYIGEYIGAPDSEMMRVGSFAVHAADIAARYTLYNHLKYDNRTIESEVGKKSKIGKMNEDQIVQTVLEAFVDYKVNMPKEMRFASAYGILLFPSFWMRIQKIMYSMAKDNPLKVGGALLLDDLLNMDSDTYYNSNIFYKFGSMINPPPVISNFGDALLPIDFYKEVSLSDLWL